MATLLWAGNAVVACQAAVGAGALVQAAGLQACLCVFLSSLADLELFPAGRRCNEGANGRHFICR